MPRIHICAVLLAFILTFKHFRSVSRGELTDAEFTSSICWLGSISFNTHYTCSICKSGIHAIIGHTRFVLNSRIIEDRSDVCFMLSKVYHELICCCEVRSRGWVCKFVNSDCVNAGLACFDLRWYKTFHASSISKKIIQAVILHALSKRNIYRFKFFSTLTKLLNVLRHLPISGGNMVCKLCSGSSSKSS